MCLNSKIKNVKTKTNNIMKTIKEYNSDFSYTIEEIDIEKEVNKSKWNNQMLFIAFSIDGRVAVVGAGPNDIKNGKSKTKIILKENNTKLSSTFLIIIPTGGINKVGSRGIGRGIKDCKCRNGIEMYLGEELLLSTPILNSDSHKNYKDEYWKKIKENKYSIIGCGSPTP